MSRNRDYILYFYGYFTVQLIFIFFNVYLPVYFFIVLDVDRSELAIIQFFSYLALLIKPVIAIYFDKISPRNIKKKILSLSSVGIIFSFYLIILSLSYLILFGIFFGINIACTSIMDVMIDKLIIEFSPNEKSKDTNALLTQIGSICGAIVPNLLFFFLFSDIYSYSTWNLFFIIGLISLFPLAAITFFLRKEILVVNYEKEEKIDSTKPKIGLKSIILMSSVLFLFYSERIYEYPLEPWILNKYGEYYFSLFALLLIMLIIINALGLILGGIISNKLDRKKLLTISMLIYGILLIIVPFTNIFLFFLLFAIIQIVSGIIVINIISLMISYSHKKVFYFQIMALFGIISIILFIPLGTYLSNFIKTEFIIMTAGVLKLLALIPILFLKVKPKE
ncbi:MAG: MFS transporter [Candidatus Lokiarchaeota archaeon]|nr:MFS transporter [Candidatus Lokiarchaeota archaeon]